MPPDNAMTTTLPGATGETLRFRMVGPRADFGDIDAAGRSLAEALSAVVADLVRETLDYAEPAIALGQFLIEHRIERIRNDLDAGPLGAHFVLHVEVTPPQDVDWASHEARWWRRRHGASRRSIAADFIVYGDDPTIE